MAKQSQYKNKDTQKTKHKQHIRTQTSTTHNNIYICLNTHRQHTQNIITNTTTTQTTKTTQGNSHTNNNNTTRQQITKQLIIV